MRFETRVNQFVTWKMEQNSEEFERKIVYINSKFMAYLQDDQFAGTKCYKFHIWIAFRPYEQKCDSAGSVGMRIVSCRNCIRTSWLENVIWNKNKILQSNSLAVPCWHHKIDDKNLLHVTAEHSNACESFAAFTANAQLQWWSECLLWWCIFPSQSIFGG